VSRCFGILCCVAFLGCAPPPPPLGLQLHVSSSAASTLAAAVAPNTPLSRLITEAAACAQGAVVASASGSLLDASVRCETVAVEGVHGTLHDDKGVVAIDGDGRRLSLATREGARRLFDVASGDVLGFFDTAAAIEWRWRSDPATMTLEGLNLPTLLLDGRTSGVVYPGALPSIALFIGLRTMNDVVIDRVEQELAGRLGSAVQHRQVAGLPADCIDGTGLLEGFHPCLVRLQERNGVVVAMNEATMVRALPSLAAAPGPSAAIHLKSMTDVDKTHPWPINTMALSPSASGVTLELK
jgi:hypothetical protein